MIDLIQNIQGLLQDSTGLSYVDDDNICLHKNEHDLIKKGTRSFINICGVDEQVQKSRTFRFGHGYEKIMKVEISFYVSSKDFDAIYLGDTQVTGIWKLKADIWAALYADRKCAGYTRDMQPSVSMRSYYTRFSDGIFWAKGVMELSYIKDEFIA